MVRETERKFEAADGVELPGWSGLAGVEALVGPEEQTVEAVYYDTEDLRLARAGVTLRRRCGGDDAGWHFKQPVGRGSGEDRDNRDEVQVGDARAGRRRTPPAELTALTRALTRGAPLAPVAELTTARRRWPERFPTAACWWRWSMTTSPGTRWARPRRGCRGVR